MSAIKSPDLAPGERDKLCINTLRMLAVDAIEKAGSGHPGMALGAAPMAYVLWKRILRHHPRNPHWPDRDRFILSAGHASALLYGLLHLFGYDLTLGELTNFRQLGSRTPGHPEVGLTPGVEATTGPLGQGIAMAVGMAMAERRLAASFNQPGYPALVDHYTYALLSDGDIMEGITYEAASLAGHLALHKLICLYDDNGISIEGPVSQTFTENVDARFSACNWHVVRVHDGEDLATIEQALQTAKAETSKPSLIIVKTHIGFGTPKQDHASSHGAPLGPEAVAATRRFFHWPEQPFHIPTGVYEHFQEDRQKGQALENQWKNHLNIYAETFADAVKIFRDRLNGQLPDGWESAFQQVTSTEKPRPTRESSGLILNQLAKTIPALWGGSADLGSSVYTDLLDEPERIIHFGLREHAMGAIANGMALHGGIIPFCGTFFVFVNYMIPAIRLAAIMRVKVIYVLSHDSIAVGEDGPTHQPVEHLIHLRALPGLVVIRPADHYETMESWQWALQHPGPVALILTRQKVPSLGAAKTAVHRGAYIKADCQPEPELIIIASGSEVHLGLDAQNALVKQGYAVRVVSMPSWEIFAAQTQEYQDSVLPPRIKKRLAIEAGSPIGWHRWVGDQGRIIAVENFGVSGPFQVVLDNFGFTVEHVVRESLGLLK